jgi:uncharacterized membrane protein
MRFVNEPPHEFAPLQLLTVAFDGNRFKGEILPELQRLKREGVARIVDMIAVRKDEAGAVAVLTASDLDWEEATEFGAYVGTLVGFGAAGPDGADRGAIAGAAELSDGHLFGEEDLERLTEVVPNGMTISIMLIEHVWALPLLQSIENADGFELRNEWVDADRLITLGASSRSSQAQG